MALRKCFILSGLGSSSVALAFINSKNVYCLLQASSRLSASNTGVKNNSQNSMNAYFMLGLLLESHALSHLTYEIALP